MKNFQDTTKKKIRIFKSIPFLLIIFIFLVIFAFGLFSFFDKMKDTAKNKIIAEEKLKNLEDRKNKLLFDISNLNTDKGKEKVFRENYGLGKEGEEVIIITDDKKSLNKEIIDVKNEGFLSKIMNLFR